MTHYVDAYGDLAPVELWQTEEGLVDAYGDPAPVETWAEDCTPDASGACTVCGVRQAEAASELPGMWEEADLSGGWADTTD